VEFALDEKRQRIHAMKADKSKQYYCPICGGDVLPRQGEINVWHFAHQSSCIDDWKYDISAWHRSWQERFPEEIREVIIEKNGECHRADILLGVYVIEFQHSPISAREFERRNQFYTMAGYKVIWVFDEIDAFANEYIFSSPDDENKYVWKWPNRVLSSVMPQYSTDVAIVLQLTKEDGDNFDWLVKVEWAIADDDGFADYRRFIIDDCFLPDLFTEAGLRDTLLNKRKRFEVFLQEHLPYNPKCGHIKGRPRSWYICPKTKDWHNLACKGCQHNLISEYRKGTSLRQGGLFFYCCYPQVANEVDENGEIRVPSIRT